MADNETTDKNRNKIKPRPYKFPDFFNKWIDEASEKEQKTTTEIIVRSSAKGLKKKVPKDHKFRAKNKKPADKG